MKSTHLPVGLGIAGVITLGLAFAPAAYANGQDEFPKPEQELAPFLDLMYAAPHENLHLGDETTVVIGQTVPASYTLVSYLANGNKCIAPHEAPAAEGTKSGGESDADYIARTIVSSGIDADNNGIDDHYENTMDKNGIAACKLKAVDEFGNMDWKYIYIAVGLPKAPPVPETPTTVTPTTVTPTTVTPTTVAPTTVTPASVAGAVVTPSTQAPVQSNATLPRTGTGTWIQALVGTVLTALGAALTIFTRRRTVPTA